MKKPQFENNEIYHVLNHGVEQRNIFADDKDHLRFIHDLYEFNDEAPAENIYYKSMDLESYEVKPRKIKERKLLVEILAFCLMPNHYHLLLKQKKDNGISRFMQKLGTGYTMSFNKKYKRRGTLFQSTYKSILIDKQNHFLNLPYYIHLNPLDLSFPEWRARKLNNYNGAMEYLGNYRWSSYLDYAGKKNFPSITNREFLLGVFGGDGKYKQNIEKWLKDMAVNDARELSLE
ncbi:MAG: transposase [Patescibacteria group bacterium]